MPTQAAAYVRLVTASHQHAVLGHGRRKHATLLRRHQANGSLLLILSFSYLLQKSLKMGFKPYCRQVDEI
jgi:hypothetical protein